jgi:hypothetical protein
MKSQKKVAKEAAQVARRSARLAEIKDGKVLMLKTPDSRKFFTFEDNYPMLIEFAKTCDAEISVVKINPDGVPVLELEELAKYICDHQVTQVDLNYELLETRIQGGTIVKKEELSTIRPNKMRKAKEINDFIHTELLAGKLITLADLESKFKDYNLSKSALCNHLRRAKVQLIDKGHKVIKLTHGRYFIKKETQ